MSIIREGGASAKSNDELCEETRIHLQNGGKVLLYNFTSASNGPGMASLTLNMMQLAMYFQERWNRTHLVIDEAQLMNYRWNEDHGLFHGYLYPNSCILSKEQTESSVFQNINICREWDMKCQILEIDADPQGFQFEKARRVAKRYYYKVRGSDKAADGKAADDTSVDVLRSRFFHDLSVYTCSHFGGGNGSGGNSLRLRPVADRLVQNQVSKIERPIDFALHIRRGDKVAGARKESRVYHANEYLERFWNQSSSLSTPKKETWKRCFVATDDYDAVKEVKEALEQHQYGCHLLTLTYPGYESTWQDRDEIRSFLAQIRLLVQAKYFVGSFSSNVGGLVALLRGCSLTNEARGDESNRYHHYFESYGVDWDDWGFL
eukprot:scaffold5707_cov112-Cylindrotheca_fusiformis.AAC.7